MCGRYTLTADKRMIQRRFAAEVIPERVDRRYNIAPSQEVLCIINDGTSNRAGFMRWGLVPSWADDPKIGFKMINARAETVHEKPAFKRLLQRRRCLIAADGFYEWKQENGVKQPYHIQVKEKPLFAFAGLWDKWEKKGEVITSCTIITTKANSLVEDIHGRMPVILRAEREKEWLDKEEDDPYHLTTLLEAFPAEKMEAYPVSPEVNHPKNEYASLINSL
nr:SOS response-associated peptidase [Bacillus sp. FJAT-44742]